MILIELLKFKKTVSSDAEFAYRIDTLPQSISKIKKGTSHFTPLQIESVCKQFNVNANWIFGLEENVFNEEKSIKNKDLKLLLG